MATIIRPLFPCSGPLSAPPQIKLSLNGCQSIPLYQNIDHILDVNARLTLLATKDSKFRCFITPIHAQSKIYIGDEKRCVGFYKHRLLNKFPVFIRSGANVFKLTYAAEDDMEIEEECSSDEPPAKKACFSFQITKND